MSKWKKGEMHCDCGLPFSKHPTKTEKSVIGDFNVEVYQVDQDCPLVSRLA